MALFEAGFLDNKVRTNLSGEKRMFVAMLERAFDDLSHHSLRRNKASRRLCDDVVGWIKSTDIQWPGSFERVCSALELDPDYLRRGISKYIGIRTMYPFGLDLTSVDDKTELKSGKNKETNNSVAKTILKKKVAVEEHVDLAPKAKPPAVMVETKKQRLRKAQVPASQLAAYEARKNRISQRKGY
jgi:hypothetical protein